MTYDADAIVVGSGPSGVSVALPLLEAGLRVMLLDGGRQRQTELPRGAYHDIRRGMSEQWRFFLGQRLEALRPLGPPSPKFDAPGSRFALAGFADSERIVGRGFTVVGSLARGGLSNIWGAGVATWGEEELTEFPFTRADLEPSYERVARRIGVTGFVDDDLAVEADAGLPSLPLMPLSDNAEQLIGRYARRRDAVRALGVRMGRPRAAVLTEPRGDRRACARCDMCVWGCSEDAIYGAVHDLPVLQAFPNLDYRPGTIARSIGRHADGFRVAVQQEGASGRAERVLVARRLVLAAGGLSTTRLVLEMRGRYGEPVPVLGAPGIGFALCLPGKIGSGVSTRDFSMAQLSFSVDGDPDRSADGAYGSLFPASGIPGALVIDRMPLTRPAAVRLFRFLQPSLMLGNCFLPGRYSRNTAWLERDEAGQARLVVEGGTTDELAGRIDRLKRQISAAFRSLGAWVVPGSFSTLGPGEEVRHAGMIPMRAEPGPGEVNRVGELHGFPGLHIVDLSTFPAMPAKHQSLTLMANADRIGRLIAAGATA